MMRKNIPIDAIMIMLGSRNGGPCVSLLRCIAKRCHERCGGGAGLWRLRFGELYKWACCIILLGLEASFIGRDERTNGGVQASL